MGYKEQLKNMTWSFSRLHAYEQCPYSFYLKYIEGREEEMNLYAENGNIIHKIFQDIFTENMQVKQCVSHYVEMYNRIISSTNESSMEKTFDKCVGCLKALKSLDKNRYEIVGVEMKLEFYLCEYKFIGYADLVVRNKKTGEIILIDHKQAPHFLKKDGTPLKNQLENFLAYKNQMYLYCIGLWKQFNLCVDKIVWHHFKDDGQLTIIPYNHNECESTKQWAIELIHTIEEDDVFENIESYIMCSSLCGFRNDCEYKTDYE